MSHMKKCLQTNQWEGSNMCHCITKVSVKHFASFTKNIAYFFSTFEFYHEHSFIHLDSRRENTQLSFVIDILHQTCHVKSSGTWEWHHYVICSPVNFQMKIRVSIKEGKIFKIYCFPSVSVAIKSYCICIYIFHICHFLIYIQRHNVTDE